MLGPVEVLDVSQPVALGIAAVAGIRGAVEHSEVDLDACGRVPVQCGINALAAVQFVFAGPAGQFVVTGPAVQDVVAFIAVQFVVVGPAGQFVVAGAADQRQAGAGGGRGIIGISLSRARYPDEGEMVFTQLSPAPRR